MSSDDQRRFRPHERVLLGCVVVPFLLLLQTVLLFWFAVTEVQGRYDDLGFIDGGGADGSRETFHLFGRLMLLVLAVELSLAGFILFRRRRRTRQRGQHQP